MSKNLPKRSYLSLVWRSGCLGLCLFGLALPAFAEEAKDLLADFVENTKTLRADFEQLLLDKNGRELDQWQGKFWLKIPGQFRWRYEKPYVQEIVGDGEKVYQYDKDLKQLTVDKQKELLAVAPTRFLFNSLSLDQFKIHDIGKLDGLRLIELVDKRGDSVYNQFLLAFKGKKLRVVEMRDALDQVTRITYRNTKINIALDPEDLQLIDIPADTDIIDRTNLDTKKRPPQEDGKSVQPKP